MLTAPWAAEVQSWLQGAAAAIVPTTYSQVASPQEIQVPIPVLRFTHDAIDSRMCFKEGEHAGHSVFAMVDQLWRSQCSPEEMCPMWS